MTTMDHLRNLGNYKQKAKEMDNKERPHFGTLSHPLRPSQAIAVACFPLNLQTKKEDLEQKHEISAVQLAHAQELAEKLRVPLITYNPEKKPLNRRILPSTSADASSSPSISSSTSSSSRYEFILEVTTDNALQLVQRLSPKGKYHRPVYVNFGGGEMTYRLKYGQNARSPLLRAVGNPSDDEPLTVVDTTAGLGKDGFIIAAGGSKVTMTERNPIVQALLADGIRRAIEESTTRPSLAKIMERIQFKPVDAKAYLKELSKADRPDVVFIDVMYPVPAKKARSALISHEMRLARQLVGDDADANELMDIAKQVAKKRVVVKRPKYTNEDPNATRIYRSNQTRYEVYDVSTTPI